MFFFFFKQKTAYEMRISDWSSDVCSSDLRLVYSSALPSRLGKGTDASRLSLTFGFMLPSSGVPNTPGMIELTRMPRSIRSRAIEIGRAHVELQSLMRISYAVFCLKKKINTTIRTHKYNTHTTTELESKHT